MPRMGSIPRTWFHPRYADGTRTPDGAICHTCGHRWGDHAGRTCPPGSPTTARGWQVLADSVNLQPVRRPRAARQARSSAVMTVFINKEELDSQASLLDELIEGFRKVRLRATDSSMKRKLKGQRGHLMVLRNYLLDIQNGFTAGEMMRVEVA